ncbi:MAG: hypothetical protein WC375_00085 [Methanomassiliicoccales archaeon]
MGLQDKNMPHQHPLISVECMKLLDFLNSERKRERKTGGENLTTILGVMGEDDKRQEDYWKSHPAEVLKFLQDESWEQYMATGEITPFPLIILEIKNVKYNSRLRGNSVSITAIVHGQIKEVNGKFGKHGKYQITATCTHAHCSRMKPPKDNREFSYKEVK